MDDSTFVRILRIHRGDLWSVPGSSGCATRSDRGPAIRVGPARLAPRPERVDRKKRPPEGGIALTGTTMVRKAVEANRAGTAAIGATDAFSRRPLSRAYRLFIGPISKAAQGRFDPFAQPSANGRSLARSGRPVSRLSCRRPAAPEVRTNGFRVRAIASRALPDESMNPNIGKHGGRRARISRSAGQQRRPDRAQDFWLYVLLDVCRDPLPW